MKYFYFFMALTHITLISRGALLSEIGSINMLPVSIEFTYNSIDTNSIEKDQGIRSSNIVYYNFMTKEYSFRSLLDKKYNLPWNILKANFFKNCYKVLRISCENGEIIHSSAVISNDPITFKNPGIIGAWISPINNKTYLDILKMSPVGKINISNDNNTIFVRFNKIYELRFDKTSMLLKEMLLYNEEIGGNLNLCNKITYESYKNINGYNIPLNIFSVFYDSKGKILSSTKYYISANSVKFNIQHTDILDFPNGTYVTDMILNKSYTITEPYNSISKEERIKLYLENYIENADNMRNAN